MNTVCANCQALNRIPDDRMDDGAKCGRCGHELFDGDVINATGATLDKLLRTISRWWSISGRHGAVRAAASRQSSKMWPKSAAENAVR